MKIEDAKIRITDLQNISQPKSKRVSAFSDKNRTEITHLRLDQLIPYSKQARTVFDEDELQSLALTIKEHGVRQPLTVLRSITQEGKYEIISGERRFRAAKINELSVIPCIIIDDKDKAEEISLVENIQRKDLHPVELAKALKSLVDLRGWGGQRELKNKLGLGESVLSELLKINTLSENIRNFLMNNNIRSREVLRQLFKQENEVSQFEFLQNLGDEQSAVGKKKRSLVYKTSVLRVFLEAGDFHVQKSRLNNLSENEKDQLRNVLSQILLDLN